MRYFGTDGIRGKFGEPPVDRVHVLALARALEKREHSKRVVMGRDTRDSGVLLRNYLIEGFPSAVEIIDLGVIMTPLLSKAVCDFQANVGIMLTASHNPASDNGIKLFNADGAKFSLKQEMALEAIMGEIFGSDAQESEVGNLLKNGQYNFVNSEEEAEKVLEKASEHYLTSGDFFNHYPRVVVDCANGASCVFAKVAYRFPEIIWIGNQPNGENINDHCGSEYPEYLIKTVKKEHAALGIAHDGDGDRVLLCDGVGQIIPGEVILGIIALYLAKIGQLRKRVIVTTPMSNVGLKIALNKQGIEVVESDVGDRNVAEKMKQLGCRLGGESSGHIIDFEKAPTSDGIQTALTFLQALSFLNLPIERVNETIPLWPRVIENITVREKVPVDQIPELQQIIETQRNKLRGQGRIFLRYSGTEPKLRLLVEAKNKSVVQEVAKTLKKGVLSCKELI